MLVSWSDGCALHVLWSFPGSVFVAGVSEAHAVFWGCDLVMLLWVGRAVSETVARWQLGFPDRHVVGSPGWRRLLLGLFGVLPAAGVCAIVTWQAQLSVYLPAFGGPPLSPCLPQGGAAAIGPFSQPAGCSQLWASFHTHTHLCDREFRQLKRHTRRLHLYHAAVCSRLLDEHMGGCWCGDR